MSAFVVNDKDISAVLQAAFNATHKYCGVSNPWRYQNDPDAYHYVMNAQKEAQQRANLLMKSNVRSVAHRYSHNSELVPEQFKGDVVLDFDAEPVSVLQALKLIDYISYQSCERPKWEESQAYKLLCELRTVLIPALPGYDNEKWGL